MYTLDDLDRKILAFLREDARTPVTEIAKRINRSRTAVQSRIEKLELAGQIQGYTIRTADDSVCISAFVTVYLHERLAPKEVISLLHTFPEVSACHRISGDADLLITLSAQSHARVQEICKALWQHENVRLTETVFALETVI